MISNTTCANLPLKLYNKTLWPLPIFLLSIPLTKDNEIDDKGVSAECSRLLKARFIEKTTSVFNQPIIVTKASTTHM
ncbi:hypothetical protein M4L39_01480 [Staphylococcus equorum]|uniref:Uncharacterized protein n=1 Tax=Staphylococcus equorum TaxID=246432 RepID=A0A9X4L6K8_9STAP|nr:hypothetical protein [Staphylococcus equorum]MDG0842092.1 hypothetical protein [Staphylococcus equorum]MDG0857857.1 hypothetical protein [Staphylococcus equorum]